MASKLLAQMENTLGMFHLRQFHVEPPPPPMRRIVSILLN